MSTQSNLSKVHVGNYNEQWVKDNWTNPYYSFESFNGDKTFDPKISKCLYIGNEIIGCYLLKKLSMIETVKNVHYWYKQGEYTDVKLFVNKDVLKSYVNKKGILSAWLYVDEKYRNNNYGELLINYCKSIGDYSWGVSEPNKSESYWIQKRNRVKIIQYKESDGMSVITASSI